MNFDYAISVLRKEAHLAAGKMFTDAALRVAAEKGHEEVEERLKMFDFASMLLGEKILPEKGDEKFWNLIHAMDVLITNEKEK